MPTDASEAYLFVSHVSQDRTVANELVSELERRGIRCWIAPRDIPGGASYDDEIAQAIDDCLAVLLVFSDRCNDSEYIRREITLAGEARKLIVPFRIEQAEPRRGLRVRLLDLHWLDAFVERESALSAVEAVVRRTSGVSSARPASHQPRGVQATRFKVGVVAPQSGDWADYGHAIADGVRLAADALGGSADCPGLSFEVLVEDDGDEANSVNRSAQAAEKLIDAGADAIVGTFFSARSFEIGYVCQRAGIAQLAPCSGAASFAPFAPGGGYFCVGVPNFQEAAISAAAASSLFPERTFVTLRAADDSSTSLRRENREMAGIFGSHVDAYPIPLELEAQELRDAVSRAGAEYCVQADYGDEILDDLDFYLDAGCKLIVHGMGPAGIDRKDRTYCENVLFVKRISFQDRPRLPLPLRGRGSGWFANEYRMYSYAAMQVLARAAASTGDRRSTALSDTIRSGSFETVLGPVQFSDFGDARLVTFEVQGWRSGRWGPLPGFGDGNFEVAPDGLTRLRSPEPAAQVPQADAADASVPGRGPAPRQTSRLKVGVVAPLSGKWAENGHAIVEGVRLASSALEGTGGRDGGAIEVIVEDDSQDENSVEASREAAQKLIDAGADAIIGSLFNSYFIAELCHRAGVVQLATLYGAASSVRLPLGDGYFCVGIPALQEEAISATVAYKRFPDRDFTTLLDPDGTAGTLGEGTIAAAEKLWHHTGDSWAPATFSEEALRAAVARDGKSFVLQTKRGDAISADLDFFLDAGCRLIVHATDVSELNRLEESSRSRVIFVRQLRFSDQPGLPMALANRKTGWFADECRIYGYGAMQVLAQGWQRVDDRTFAAMCEALHEGVFETVLGPLRFSEQGDARLVAHEAIAWIDGRWSPMPGFARSDFEVSRSGLTRLTVAGPMDTDRPAICICQHCGSSKIGAFSVCEECRLWPFGERMLAEALYLSEHHISRQEMHKASVAIRNGEFPECDEAIIAHLIEKIGNNAQGFIEDGLLPRPGAENPNRPPPR